QVCQAQPGGGKRARQHLEHLLERHPTEPRAYEALAALETEEHGFQKAIDWLRLGLKKVPGEINLRWNLAHLLAHTGDLVGARETLGPIPERAVPVARMKYLRAVLEAQEGKWLAASKSLEAVRPLLTGEPSLVTQADMLLGRCYEGL